MPRNDETQARVRTALAQGGGPDGDQLQDDIAAALRASIVLPPYDEVLRLIDALTGHLALLVEQAKEHVKGHDRGDVEWYRERAQIDNARYQLESGPGSGLASAARHMQSLARAAQQLHDLPHHEEGEVEVNITAGELQAGDCVLDVQRDRQGIVLSVGPSGYEGVWLRPVGGEGREWQASPADIRKLAVPGLETSR